MVLPYQSRPHITPFCTGLPGCLCPLLCAGPLSTGTGWHPNTALRGRERGWTVSHTSQASGCAFHSGCSTGGNGISYMVFPLFLNAAVRRSIAFAPHTQLRFNGT
jgi:hypothetical protein